MNIVVLLLYIFSIFLISGCSSKEQIVFKDRFVCFDMLLIEKGEEVAIRVHKDDRDLFVAKKDELDSKIDFYETQIKSYLENCKNF